MQEPSRNPQTTPDDHRSRSLRHDRIVLFITLAYVGIAFIWIIFSDLFFYQLVGTDTLALYWSSTLKGIGFVAVTGLALYGLLRIYAYRVSDTNRRYRTLSTLNRAIIHLREPEQIAQTACRIAVEEGHYRLAWVGIVTPGGGPLNSLAAYGIDNDYVRNIQIDTRNEESMVGPGGQTLRSGRHHIIDDTRNDPRFQRWRERALVHGFRSVACFPLKVNGRTIGVFCCYADRPHAFNEREVELLSAFSGDLTFALEKARVETERHAMVKQLAANEQRFRLLVEQSPDAIYRINYVPEPKTDYISPAIQAITGYRPEEFYADRELIRHIVHTDDQYVFQPTNGRIAGSEQPVVVRMIHREGHIVWTEQRTLLIRDEQGRMVAIEGITRDISDRIRAEAALQRYRLLSEHARDIVLFVRRRDGLITEANRAAEHAYGLTRTELVQRTIFNLRAPETRTLIDAQMIQAATAASGFLFETTHLHSDGHTFPVEVSSVGTIIDDEEILLSTIRDISVRKAAEAERELLRSALLTSANGVVITDRNGCIEWVNPAFTTLTGYSEREAIGGTPSVLRSGVHDDAFYKQLWQTVLSGAIWQGELVNRRKNGTLYYEEMTITPVRIGGSSITHFIAIKQDITQRKHAEAELSRSHASLIDSYDTTLAGWSNALDLRDRETEGHSRRVAEMTVLLARTCGVAEEQIEHIRRGAMLHDIGKLGIPDAILHKPGPLSDEEWDVMRRHPGYAYDLLKPIAFLQPALDIPSCHHERWNGSGYPRGLRGTEIPFAARIFAVVDVWDALRSDRPYRAGWPDAKIRAYLAEEAGNLFDPDIVDVFLGLLAEEQQIDAAPNKLQSKSD
jgi:PAS domain S-box-containing protein